MRITRLRVANFRQFIAPLEIRDLEAGLNLFTGPNESGKSTLVRAIQAAFFERHKSSSVGDLEPRANGQGGPEVELDFDTQEKSYRLKKRFLDKKVCELTVGTQVLKSDEAEELLTNLLGFNLPDRGPSKLEHRGIPGLLWVEQGTVQTVQASLDHAGDHLRGALHATLGAIASSQGDEVIEAVQAAHDELLTSSTGKPRNAFAEALKKRDLLSGKVADLTKELKTYQDQVDRLGALTRVIQEEESNRTWDALEAQEKAANDQLAAISKLRGELEQKSKERDQLAGHIELLKATQQGLERKEKDLELRGKALELLTTALEGVEGKHDQAQENVLGAKALVDTAEKVLALAQQEEKRAALTGQIKDLEPQLKFHQDAKKIAEASARELVEIQKVLSVSKISPADLKRVQKQDRDIQDLQLKQMAAATRLGFDLSKGQALDLDGRAIKGKGEETLVQAARLILPGLGVLTITPGGSDLENYAAEQAKLEKEHQALLKKLGVKDLAEAEAHMQAASKAGQQEELQQARLEQAAPEGLPALDQSIAGFVSRIAEAHEQLGFLPKPPAEAPVSVKKADRTRIDAYNDWEDAREKAVEASEEAIKLGRDAENARLECSNLKAEVTSSQHILKVQETASALLEDQGQLAELKRQVTTQEEAIQLARPDQFEQDAKRFRKSADQAFKAYQDHKLEHRGIQGSLEQAGSQGIEETLASAAAELERTQGRAQELERRGACLTLLLDLLRQKRQELTTQLMVPIKDRMEHYLGLLFPGAILQVGENLGPVLVQRPRVSGAEAMEVDLLSYGAREQIGLICRLAYADLLKEAGRPTLIILDDALVHSDLERLESMKRILFDASERHQILLFTCHPKIWEDLGATVRSMESLRAEVLA